MATERLCGDLVLQFRSMSVVRRALGRRLPQECHLAGIGVLALLREHGELRMGQLAERLATDMSVTSRQVADLADRGWIDRLPDPGDRRSRLLRITPAGREVLREAHARCAQALAACLQDWTDDEVIQLTGLLVRLRESFDAASRTLAHGSDG